MYFDNSLKQFIKDELLNMSKRQLKVFCLNFLCDTHSDFSLAPYILFLIDSDNFPIRTGYSSIKLGLNVNVGPGFENHITCSLHTDQGDIGWGIYHINSAIAFKTSTLFSKIMPEFKFLLHDNR